MANFQIIVDGRDTNAVDKEGCQLPTLVYMAREKRPGCPHNFKAGAMNALVFRQLTSKTPLVNFMITGS